jgi:hypothetical protein
LPLGYVSHPNATPKQIGSLIPIAYNVKNPQIIVINDYSEHLVGIPFVIFLIALAWLPMGGSPSEEGQGEAAPQPLDKSA